MSEQNIVGVHTKDLRSNYSEWITAWTSHLLGQSFGIKVPSTAMAVNTPLNVKSWQEALSDHPNRLLVECFLCRISQGFCIGFKQPANSSKSSKRNLSCALQHPETVEKYLTEEIAIYGKGCRLIYPIISSTCTCEPFQSHSKEPPARQMEVNC